MQIDDNWKKVTILPGCVNWPVISQAIKHPSMQYEAKDGDSTSLKITVRKPKVANYFIVTTFFDKECSTFDVYEEIEKNS